MPGRALQDYRRKRDFERTREPAGHAPAAPTRRRVRAARFVIQKHDASHLHYDFRLEMAGVLRSWAVPKGPSLDPADRRLAVQVEDHPIEYGKFEGTIPEHAYGGGTVLLWDRGTWTPEGDPVAEWRDGHLDFTLNGEKLHGRWTLVKLRRRDTDRRDNWLLIKRSDAYARLRRQGDVLVERPASVTTGRDLDDIAAGRPARRRQRATAKSSAGARAAAPAQRGAPRAANGQSRAATGRSHGATGRSRGATGRSRGATGRSRGATERSRAAANGGAARRTAGVTRRSGVSAAANLHPARASGSTPPGGRLRARTPA